MRKSLIGGIVLLFLFTAVSAVPVNTTNIFGSIAYSLPGDLAILESKYDPIPAEPGNYLNLWVSVQNWGSADLNKVYIKAKPEFPFYLDPWDNGIEQIGTLGSLKERIVEFKLKVDEAAVEGDNTLDIAWCADSKCQREYKTKTITINVKTGGSPDLLTVLEDSDLLMHGSNGEATIGFINRGKLDIKFLTVTLLPTETYELISPNQIYIGELDSDDSDSADYEIYIKPQTFKGTETITLPLKIEYSDSNYKKYTEQRNIDLKIYSQMDAKKYGLLQSGNSSITYIIGFIILIAIGYFGWKWWKKRKKRHK